MAAAPLETVPQLTSLGIGRLCHRRAWARPIVSTLVLRRLIDVPRPKLDLLTGWVGGHEDVVGVVGWGDKCLAHRLAGQIEYRGAAEGLAWRLPLIDGDRFVSVAIDTLDLLAWSVDNPQAERMAQSKILVSMVRFELDARGPRKRRTALPRSGV